jgi:hypothetical protein
VGQVRAPAPTWLMAGDFLLRVSRIKSTLTTDWPWLLNWPLIGIFLGLLRQGEETAASHEVEFTQRSAYGNGNQEAATKLWTMGLLSISTVGRTVVVRLGNVFNREGGSHNEADFVLLSWDHSIPAVFG